MMLAEHQLDLLRSLESASLAIGRLDAVTRATEPGIQELLTLRCSVITVDESSDRASNAASHGIIAILRADGEGGTPAHSLANTLREGFLRSRAGSAPTVRWLADALDRDALRDVLELDALDEELRTLLPGRGAVLAALRAGEALAERSPLAASAITALVLAHGGALGGPWCTVPIARFAARTDDTSEPLVLLADALARAAQDAESALEHGTRAMLEHEATIDAAYGRASHGAISVLRSFRRWMLLDIPSAARRLRCTRPTVAAAVERLESLGLVTELTGRGRDRVWCYSALAEALAEALVAAPATKGS